MIAEQGATVIAVENISPEAIQDAVEQLQNDGIDEVALIGGSAGADAILDLASQDPDLPDQLILLSPNATVEGLGEEPKLFIASEDEPVADVSTELAESAPGEENEAQILPGSAHAQNIFDTDQAGPVLDAMLERLARFATD
ncbi:MAG: alpha/beta hydrolase [Geodermatophilaceae bacterium]